MNKNSLSIEYRNVAELLHYARNLRIHSGAQKRKLRAGLQKFGQIIPIIIDDTNVVIDGHAVLKEWAGRYPDRNRRCWRCPSSYGNSSEFHRHRAGIRSRQRNRTLPPAGSYGQV